MEKKSSNLVKSHEVICHLIRLYLVPLPPCKHPNVLGHYIGSMCEFVKETFLKNLYIVRMAGFFEFSCISKEIRGNVICTYP